MLTELSVSVRAASPYALGFYVFYLVARFSAPKSLDGPTTAYWASSCTSVLNCVAGCRHGVALLHGPKLRLPEGGPKVPAAERRDGERLWRAVAGHAAAAGRAAAGRAGRHGA